MAETVAVGPRVGGRTPLIVSLVLGAVAAGLVVAALASRNSSSTPTLIDGAMVSVVVARESIPVGTKISAEMVELKTISAAAAVSDPVSDVKNVVGQVSRFPVSANEQFSQGQLIQAAQGNTLSFAIPPGLRGVAINVDRTTSPTELIAPGDFVDVIVTARAVSLATSAQAAPVASANSNPDLKASVTLIQNAQVLSVQRNFVANGVPYDSTVRGKPDDKTDGSYVTLALTPDQAQLLALASQDGKVTLTLRAFGDSKVADVAPIAEPLRVK